VITGIVNANREAVLRLTLFDVKNLQHEISTIVDTGFNGYLTLPPDSIEALGLTWLRVLLPILDGAAFSLRRIEIP
jgi:predicted aspartyl protease